MPFKRISKNIKVHLVAYAIFWINSFSKSTPDAVLSDTKGPIQLFLGAMVNYKKIFGLQPGKYIQVHQNYEPCNTIAINWTVCAIVLGPQYNLQEGFFKNLLTGKRLRWSHWNPVTLTEDAIELYNNFNTKCFSRRPYFWHF